MDLRTRTKAWAWLAALLVLSLSMSLRVGAASAVTADTEVLRVADAPLFAPEYVFWLRQAARNLTATQGPEALDAWSTERKGMSLQTYLTGQAIQSARRVRAIRAQAQALGLQLSAQDLKRIEDKRLDGIRAYGGVMPYLAIVRRMYVSEEVLDQLSQSDLLGERLFERLYGTKGERCSDAQVADYVAAQQLQRAKYIHVAAGEGRRAQMQALVERLDAGGDAEALFDELGPRYNEDTRMAAQPQGRLFAAGSMGEAFDRAYAALGENQHSGVVDDGSGYTILLRLPIRPDTRPDDDEHTLRYWAAYNHLFKPQVDAWAAQLTVAYTPAFAALDAVALARWQVPGG